MRDAICYSGAGKEILKASIGTEVMALCLDVQFHNYSKLSLNTLTHFTSHRGNFFKKTLFLHLQMRRTMNGKLIMPTHGKSLQLLQQQEPYWNTLATRVTLHVKHRM